MGFLSGIGGLILLLLNIWAVLSILKSRAPTVNKLLWILLILVLPFIGFVIWFIAGPKGM